MGKWIWAAVRWEMEKRRLNGRRCSWPLSAEFVKDCTTRKRKMNNIDEIIFLNGIRPFLLCALVYKHTTRKVSYTRVGPKISFENTHMRLRGFCFLLSQEQFRFNCPATPLHFHTVHLILLLPTTFPRSLFNCTATHYPYA